LLDSAFSEQWGDTIIAEGQIHECLQKIDQVLRVVLGNTIARGALLEGFDHGFWALLVNHALAAIVVNGQLFKGPCGCGAHGENIVLQQVLHVRESVVKELSSNSAESEGAKQKS